MFHRSVKFPGGLNVHRPSLVLSEIPISVCGRVCVRHLQTAGNLAPASTVQLHVPHTDPCTVCPDVFHPHQKEKKICMWGFINYRVLRESS